MNQKSVSNVLKIKRGRKWGEAETQAFVDILLKRNAMKLLDGKKFRNKQVFSVLQKDMKMKGFDRNCAQLIVKFKNLKSDFAKIKGRNQISGVTKRTLPLEEKLSHLFDTRENFKELGSENSSESLADESSMEFVTLSDDSSVDPLDISDSIKDFSDSESGNSSSRARSDVIEAAKMIIDAQKELLEREAVLLRQLMKEHHEFLREIWKEKDETKRTP
ncbi:uncharacterized protein LOC132255442 [Phlebotomus argentipes]|uniref:uncharacterized protein LOC132255442 n=1 Tax=Phlebotomus argentipes TaxID=94469 RepID=UPI002892B363|nr:uncharacterized protein LOC132255442 [Phlebotomus argentipes]